MLSLTTLSPMQSRYSIVLQVFLAILTLCFFFTLTKPRVGATATYPSEPERPNTIPLADVSVLERGPHDERVVALTFDACSTDAPGHYDERITKVLVETKTPATLFLGGKWIEEQMETVRGLASNPLFELANHAYLHPHLNELTDEQVRHELDSTQKILYSVTGKHASLFRPPYGEYTERTVRIAASLGLTTVQFDLASGDPDPAIGKERLIQYVSSKARNGSIIVMHINRRGWHTAEALPEIISRLRHRGFTFKTVSEMINPGTPAREH